MTEPVSTVASHPDPIVGRLVGERYLVLSELARTDAGVLLRAEDARMGRPAAVLLATPALSEDPAALERSSARASRASLVIHRGVAPIYDVGRTTDGRLFVATAYAGETPLSALLGSGTPAPPATALDLAHRAADALAVAHALGVVHGRLSPELVLVGSEGARIVGFGVEAPGMPAGAEPDPRDDVARLTAILHRMLGAAPAGAALAGRRFATAEELRDAVADARMRLTARGRHVEPPARPIEPRRQRAREQQRQTLMIGAIVTAVGGALLAAITLIR